MRAWKVVGAVLAVAGAVVGSGAMWIGSVAVRRKGEMERRVAGLLAEARSRDPLRPVLYGQAVPGNAWDEYDRALVLVHQARPSFALFEKFLARDPETDLGQVRRVVTGFGKALDALQAGAHRAQGAFPSNWESGSGVRRPVLAESRYLMMFAAARARLLTEAGRTREAFRLLLDAVQYSHDLAQNSFEFGYSSECYRIVLDELRGMVSTVDLERDEAAELALALERADESFPPLSICEKNAVLVQGIELLMDPARRAFNPELHPEETWRYGFSHLIVEADALESWARMVERADIDDRGPWTQTMEAHEALREEIHRHKNPLVRFIRRDLCTVASARECRTQLRLVRAAVGAGDLEDPFGGRLLRSGKRIWSVGRDGTDDAGDDGGEPGWLWRRNRGPIRASKDIVIEVPR